MFSESWPLRANRSILAFRKTDDTVGEVLINNSGKVARVWATHEVEFKPPFPSFNSSITDAIRQWEFEQSFMQGKPVPVCMTVTVNINWK